MANCGFHANILVVYVLLQEIFCIIVASFNGFNDISLNLGYLLLQEIFQLIVSSFKGLNDKSSPDFHIRVGILEIVATTKCCVVMLDLQCDDLILEMFRIFFQTVR